MAPETQVTLTENTVIAERFRLIRELGQGGMGSVWLAHHITLDVECALKFIHADAAALDEVRGRFEREARAAAKLRSPHIVQILDHGAWEGVPYIAMELLLGEDLSTRLERRIRLSAKETTDIVAQVARALTRAHAADLVHRDLKPANLFLVPDDDREIVKVLDFGIAKSISALEATGLTTRTGALLGTPAYMSPEQAQGTKKVDHRTDLWSLAVIAFECLTGQRPFDSPALGDLLMQIITNPLPVPSQFAPVPRGFDAFWARAAARDPDARYQSAKELAEALAEALDMPIDDTRQIGSRSSFADALTADLPRPAATMGAAATLAAAPLEIASAPRRPPRPRRGPIAAAALVMLGSAAIVMVALRALSPAAAPTAVPLDVAAPPRIAGIPAGPAIALQATTGEPSITPQPLPSASAPATASASASASASTPPLLRAKSPRPAASPSSRPRYDDGI